MPNYRRCYVPGGTYFFTVVTLGRRRFLTDDPARECLRIAILDEQARRPFEVVAIVLLPDHLHTIWTLPTGDSDFSVRWSRIKEQFTRNYLGAARREGLRNPSRQRKRERGIWQRRFWEHCCRDEADLKAYLDYVHWNPVKHGLVKDVSDWPWSSFHRYVQLGEYEPAWGDAYDCPMMAGAEPESRDGGPRRLGPPY